MTRVSVVFLTAFIISCAFIKEDRVAVVTLEPKECEFLAYLDQVHSNSWKEGINELQRDTIRLGGNRLYLPPDEQTVLVKIVGGKFLSIGTAYLCADKP